MKFICDSMLGSLARRMRMAGIDTDYWHSPDPMSLARKAEAEERTVLTRSQKFMSGKCFRCNSYFVTAQNVDEQFDEIIRHFAIEIGEEHFMSRCLECNGKIIRIDKEEAEGRVPDYVYFMMNEFSRCQGCGKIFWKGTHYKNMLQYIKK